MCARGALEVLLKALIRGWRWLRSLRTSRAFASPLPGEERVPLWSADVGRMARIQPRHADRSGPLGDRTARTGGARTVQRRAAPQSDLQQRLLPQRAPSPPAPARRLPSPAQRAPSPEPGLLRQKTVCPLLIEQLASALTLVRSIGLELEGGLVLPPSTPVRKQHLSNREVATVSEELLGMARSAIEELAQVGYTDVEVLQMLQQQSPALAWLGDRSLKSVKVGGAGGRRALKGRLNKWWELQTAKARTRLGAAPSEQLCERKKRQAELLVKLRDSVLMLDAAVQIGVAEAEDDLCTICMERPRTVVLQHVLRRAEDRHQVCHECIAVLLQTNARCPFCNEAVAYG